MSALPSRWFTNRSRPGTKTLLIAALGMAALAVGSPEIVSAQQSPAKPILTAPPSSVPHTQYAPVFTLTDANGVRRSLQDYRGRPVVLFFYCGCEPCHECARAWEQAQQTVPANPKTDLTGQTTPSASNAPLPTQHLVSNTLTSESLNTRSPATLVIFTDNAGAAHDFARDTGLDLRRTTLLIDAQLQVTRVYHAAPCPRLFVLDAAGAIRYTNDDVGEQSKKMTAASLVALAQQALRTLSSVPTASTALTVPASPAIRSLLPAAPAVHLTILHGTGLEETGAGMAQWDAGETDAWRTPQLERSFALKNETAQPITIARVQGSCGCQTVSLTKNGQPTRQPTLNPGETADVTVAIRLAGQHTGSLRKYVWAYAVGNPSPLATLEIRFSIREMVRFSPPYVNFGRVIAGTAQALPLTVEVDASALPVGNGMPSLTCANTNVQLVPEGDERRVLRDGHTWLTRAYRVTLAAATPPGYVSGRLQIALPATGVGGSLVLVGPRSSARPERSVAGGSALSPVPSVSLLGEVIGEIAVAPKTAYFGTVSLIKGQTRQLLLSGPAVSALTDASLSSNTDAVTLRLHEAPSSVTTQGQASRLLEVTLTESASPGRLRAEITILSAKGERLVIPVIADITKPQ